MKWSEILGWVGLAAGAYYGSPGAGRAIGSTAGGILDDPGKAFEGASSGGGMGGIPGMGGGGAGGGIPGLDSIQGLLGGMGGQKQAEAGPDQLDLLADAAQKKVQQSPGILHAEADPRWWSALSSEQEAEFRAWYRNFSTKNGLDPNPDDPNHKYDYRAYFQANQESHDQYSAKMDETDGLYHLPSLFKHADHPNRFIDLGSGSVLDSITGQVLQ